MPPAAPAEPQHSTGYTSSLSIATSIGLNRDNLSDEPAECHLPVHHRRRRRPTTTSGGIRFTSGRPRLLRHNAQLDVLQEHAISEPTSEYYRLSRSAAGFPSPISRHGGQANVFNPVYTSLHGAAQLHRNFCPTSHVRGNHPEPLSMRNRDTSRQNNETTGASFEGSRKRIRGVKEDRGNDRPLRRRYSLTPLVDSPVSLFLHIGHDVMAMHPPSTPHQRDTFESVDALIRSCSNPRPKRAREDDDEDTHSLERANRRSKFFDVVMNPRLTGGEMAHSVAGPSSSAQVATSEQRAQTLPLFPDAQDTQDTLSVLRVPASPAIVEPLSQLPSQSPRGRSPIQSLRESPISHPTSPCSTVVQMVRRSTRTKATTKR